jgi:hypothetical protein
MHVTIRTIAALAFVVISTRSAVAACAVDRGPVKTATDAQAADIRLAPILTTIDVLHTIPAPRPLPQDGRVAPAETSIYAVTATLIAYARTPQNEIHLVLSDEARRTIIAKIPAPECVTGSRLASDIVRPRTAFERQFAVSEIFTEVRQPVEVQGVGFFDFFQGQRGLAPNAISLHPVTSIDFTPAFQPKPPTMPGRRRAVGGGGARSCARPTLSITTSKSSACATEQVTIAWQSSDASARVAIDGIGTSLPASGSRSVSMSASSAYSGRATNGCGAGIEAVAVVTLSQEATASLTGPSTVTSGSTSTLSILMSNAISWTLTSSLGNPITPNSGTTGRSASYSANTIGSDTVTLRAMGGACGTVTATHTIFVQTKDNPPPPTTGGLRCCDGTRSPSCFNCQDKRGCCSGHGGVCGCP